MQATYQLRWIILSGLLLVLFILNLSLGSIHIPMGEIIGIVLGGEGTNPIWTDIIWDFRLTKALTCILGGGALAIGGLLMQTLFRNALAGPDVLGLSSGASLAVSLTMMGQVAGFQFFSTPNPWSIVIAASFGSALVFFVVFIITQRLRENTSLLIIGLMMGAATSSLVSVLQFLSDAEDQQAYLLWTFGTMGSLSWTEIQVLFVALMIGCVISLLSVKSLNAWLLGDNYAKSIGVNINKSRMLIIFSTSILTGSVTAFCGPIAFVGLAVPHLTKLIIKTHNHLTLVPAVMISGAILMLFCDIICQLPGSAYVLPINAITALIGAPVVIWIVLKAKRVAV